jgi:hypothetical protein
MDTKMLAKDKVGLNGFETVLVSILFFFLLFFADIVQIRSAFLTRVMGDADCFFRAGWAAKVGKSIYEVTDPNGWHYNYPPLFAIAMIPLADPPPGESRVGCLPYPISISIFYKVSLLSLFLGVFSLARAYEKQFPLLFENLSVRKWYYLRIFAIVVCLSPIAHTLMRGQVNLFLLMMICLAISFQISNRSFLSGVMIAGSICLKVFPVFLLIVPVWRKDYKQFAGCVVGLILGLVVIPVSVMGVEKTKTAYSDFYNVLIGPSLGISGDNTRGIELTNLNSTDNHSVLAFLHGIEHPDFSKKPAKPSLVIKIVQILMSILFLGWLLWSKGVPQKGSAMEDAHFLALASLLMVLICPVSHSQYFVLALPLVMSLLVFSWFDSTRVISPWLGVLFLFYIVANLLPLLPFFESIKRMGVMFVPNFILMVYGTTLFANIRRNDQLVNENRTSANLSEA